MELSEETKTCIFNSDHVVPKEYYRAHLIRCRLQHKPSLVACPYNPEELHCPLKMIRHMRTCSSKPRKYMTYDDHKDTFDSQYPRNEFYVLNWDEDDEDTGPPPVQCPYNKVELIYADKLRDHMFRCDFAKDYYRQNPVICEPDWNSDSD